MYVDAHNQYCDAQAFTATAASTSYIDHGSDRNLGVGEPLALFVLVDVASDFTTGNETYSLAWETDDNSSFSSAATLRTITLTGAVAAGTKFVTIADPDTTFEQYSRLNFTLGGTTPTVTLTAFLVPACMVQNDRQYPDGITIS